MSETTGTWVSSGPGLPCGARILGDADDGRVWVDICTMGQHLPQMYPPAEVHGLDAAGCARLGLCPDCLGFGDTAPGIGFGLAEVARGIDEVAFPCAGCGGSGRPALRVTLTRDPSGVTGDIRPLPHAYVPPLDDSDAELRAVFGVPDDMCLACGMPPGGTGPHGEALHPEAA